MNNSYTIKANVGVDQYLNVSLKQDIDIYEILSLELKQENLYKLHSADYGVIVGRVLANDAFGIPNAKVSVFLPLSDEDKLNQYIRTVYPYSFVNDTDKRNVKYNLLPNFKRYDCHQEVGSFPKKQLVLDNDSVIEIYDKYYKYTTVTNGAGDYMIFGVPTGEQMLHVDVDLSDIGILSQEPRDFIYKGYSLDLFESQTQFKKSTNLDNLPQLFNQSTSVTVYPLWGDKDSNEIAITRKDITLQYKFETTCVFLGSVITDNGSSYISPDCIPDGSVGEASQLTVSKGNIEMIRKTIDDNIEEYIIKGNQLIDGDGVWCYQIPMNLDYVGTDEKGNIVPTNDINKGIPTRARVRFRITLDENGVDGSNSHKARYLVPNNPDLINNYTKPVVSKSILDGIEDYYEFGTKTPEDCFRDLYWNKVYSVKGYIPRIQKNKYDYIENYLAIKGVNKKEAKKNNLLPFNKINLNLSLPAFNSLQDLVSKYYGREYDTSNFFAKIFSDFWRFYKSYSIDKNFDTAVEKVLEEEEGIALDFYNDWLNGCLYFPSWFWHLKTKRDIKNGKAEYDSLFCECKNTIPENASDSDKMMLFNNGSYIYRNCDLSIDTKDTVYTEENGGYKFKYTFMPYGSKEFYDGVIKKKETMYGDDVFYYSYGTKLKDISVGNNEEKKSEYARLFSTDIILLGSLKDDDIDGVSKIMYNLPTTTSNIPTIGTYKPHFVKIETEEGGKKTKIISSDTKVSFNGMNWGDYWRNNDISRPDDEYYDERYKYYLGSGLFFGVYFKYKAFPEFGNIYDGYVVLPHSDLKTVPNVERICELGVTLDSNVNYTFKSGISSKSKLLLMDGLITKREIENVDLRAQFASMNYKKLIGEQINVKTGYKKYDLKFLYPNNFDGRMENISQIYTSAETESNQTKDYRNKDYLDFRFGSKLDSIDTDVLEKERHFYGYSTTDNVHVDYNPGNKPYAFPLYNNSFYFYFGLNQGSTAIEKFYEQFYADCSKG